jgi:hypothetical protein
MIDWPPNYVDAFAQRQQRLRKIKTSNLYEHAKLYYSTRPVEFIGHWCVTYDPRNVSKGLPTIVPLLLFDKQKELVDFLLELIGDEESGLIEKSRDMGATWVSCAFSVWLWLFHPGAAIGWGSRKELLVDRIGDPDSIFEKMRMVIRYLPGFFMPKGFNPKDHLTHMKCINPANDSTITGEAGDNIGRGGRKLIYFKDESAHYERPELIESALGDNTNVQVDISSVNGAGNLFFKKRHSKMTRVFIMDWRDHPAKTQEWYDKRKAKADSEGLTHIFGQEVDRDYNSSVEGILIPAKYVNAAIDAHIKLGFEGFGNKRIGLDVADEGEDKNALCAVYGPLVTDLDEWAEGDTGQTAIRGYNYALEHGCDELVYDSIGVGAGVKAKTNELSKLPKNVNRKLSVVGFNAGAGIVNPNKEYIEGKTNHDMFCNHKAQAWWEVRDRFHKTYLAVIEGKDVPHEELISLPSNLNKLNELKMELSRPKRDTDGAGRIKVESKKDMKKRGMPSPNLADALIMCYAPLHKKPSICIASPVGLGKTSNWR